MALIKTELNTATVTENCQVFHDQRVDLERADFDGFNDTVIRCNEPDIGLCIIDMANGKAFIVEVANLFGHFVVEL